VGELGAEHVAGRDRDHRVRRAGQHHVALTQTRAERAEVGAADKADAEVAFEGGDVRADARLGAVDRRRRSREPAAVRDSEEGFQPGITAPNPWPRVSACEFRMMFVE
jgi:hypothetical protein